MVLVALVGFGVYSATSTWDSVNRVDIERPAESDLPLAAPESGSEDSGSRDSPQDPEVTIPPSKDGLDVYLIVGSDSRDALEDTEGFGDFGGQRADVVMVMVNPRDERDPVIISLPRDLLVDDVCTGGVHRLNDALEGCGENVNGPTELTLTVEAITGLAIDHFAMADLAGFQDVVDEIGGYEICLEYPVRDEKARLELPAGCTNADGDQALAWFRSRRTQEYVDGRWRVMSGVSDLTRNERQREFMVTMMATVSDFGSPQEMLEVAGAVAPNVTVDSGLSIFEAVGLAWTLRDINSVASLEVPVADATTPTGAAVLVATVPVAEIIEAHLGGEAAPTLSQ